MTEPAQFKSFGVSVSPSVAEALSDRLYEDAGVLDLAAYFDPSTDVYPAGDPGAEASHDLVAAVVADFADLYDAADFAAARAVDPGAFELVYVAAKPQTVAAARERFEAAATIQESDLRTVHTAILAARLEVEP